MTLKKSIIPVILLLVISNSFAQVQIDKFSGDASYGLPLITVPNFRGPSISTSLFYRSDIKVDQPASEVGLGWSLNAGGSIERVVKGVPDDWKSVTTANMQSGTFQTHRGALHFDKSGTAQVLDFDYSRYKLDSTINDSVKFYFPSYDTYYVVGEGMAGEISPENYNYAKVKVTSVAVKRWFYFGNPLDSIEQTTRMRDSYVIDATYKFDFKTQFRYAHNNYAETNSRYFPWSSSPLTSSSKIYIPNDSVGGSQQTFNGAGYNDETHNDVGNRNRTRTSNYIEYFTNTELDAGVAGFLEYDDTFDRSVTTDFPADGIGAYRITDPNGFVYHYSLPVYAHYSTNGSLPLDKDNNVVIGAYGGAKMNTDAYGNYILENLDSNEIFEAKQNAKYAIRWLLTAITGPDFEDTNSSGTVDLNDKGYWVKYDYGLWSESFQERFPYYGGQYAYTSSMDEGYSAFMDQDDASSVSGKMMFYSETANQSYYLNDIQTPSHTAIFTRDLRYDEQSMIASYNKSDYLATGNLNSVDTIDCWSGSGSFSKSGGGNDYYHYLTIKPQDIDDLTLYIDDISYNGINWSFIVLDGDTATGDTLVNVYNGCSCSAPDSVNATNKELTIVAYKQISTNSLSYDIHWQSHWDNATGGWPEGRPKAMPQLKLSKMFLFDNDDLADLPTLTAVDTVTDDELWDYTNLNRSSCYNNDWYLLNKSKIDSLALQSVDLVQDYSLAKGYNNNRYVYIDVQSKAANQLEIENNKYIDTGNVALSGKLTLNKVIYYGLHKTQTQPAHLFDYNAADTIDNPNYNHIKQDYWGNYKSDAENNLLRGYVTTASADKTDAWSLRKITSPLGGITEIIYETDEYEQVINERLEGGLRGPIKTFAIKDADAEPTDVRNWTFDIENQETEFWNLANNLPTGATQLAVIPGVWKSNGEYLDWDIERPFYYGSTVCSGSGTLSQSPNEITSLDYFELSMGEIDSAITSSLFCLEQECSLYYAGAGYISFNYPIGETIKGGGTRVKELKVINNTDSFVVAYTYEEGTATAEAGDFDRGGKTKKDPDAEVRYTWGLTAFEPGNFNLSPQVGYGKVTTENRGLDTAGEGNSVYSFHVSPENKNYFQPYVGVNDTSWQYGNCGVGTYHVTQRRFACEIIDDFSTLWGKIKSQTLRDINGIMVSKKAYEYTKSTKGAHVSLTNYDIKSGQSSCYIYGTYISCIFREYPNYLNKVITYSNGRKSESLIVDRDPFTGNPIETKTTSINGSTSTEEIVHAYTLTSPNYKIMGAKSDSSDYKNFLNGTYSSKSFKASEGLATADFSSYGKSFWKDSVTTRYYNATDNEYTTKTDTVNYFDYAQYAWAGNLGNYGLFDTTGFIDITSPPVGESNWRFLSEITLMDENQNVLEQKGFNNRFSASKLGYDNRFTYTSASNANYVSFTATGFETMNEVEAGVNYFEGEVLAQSGNTQLKVDGAVYPHTGNYMVKIASGSDYGPIYSVNYNSADDIYSLQRGRVYTASVWVHKNSPADTKLNIDIEGDADSAPYSESDTMSIANPNAIQIGDWIQLTVNIEVPADFTGETAGDGIAVYVDKTTAANAWVDDMQFKSRVTGSGMNVYDQRTGRVMATLSDNNFATKYVYNNVGQVTEVWKEVLGPTWGKWVKVEARDFNFERAME